MWRWNALSSNLNAADLASPVRQCCPLGGDALKAQREGYPFFAVMRWRVAQGQADQGGRCLSRRRVQPDPDWTEQRSVPVASRRDSASGCLFFCLLFFGQAKKSESPPGRDPARIRNVAQFEKPIRYRPTTHIHENQMAERFLEPDRDPQFQPVGPTAPRHATGVLQPHPAAASLGRYRSGGPLLLNHPAQPRRQMLQEQSADKLQALQSACA